MKLCKSQQRKYILNMLYDQKEALIWLSHSKHFPKTGDPLNPPGVKEYMTICNY